MAKDISIVDILDKQRVEHVYHGKDEPMELQEAPISSLAIESALESEFNRPLTVIDMTDIPNKEYMHINKIGFGGNFVIVQRAEGGRTNIFIREVTDYDKATDVKSDRTYMQYFPWPAGGTDTYELPDGTVYKQKYSYCLPKSAGAMLDKINLTIKGIQADVNGTTYDNVFSYTDIDEPISATITYPNGTHTITTEPVKNYKPTCNFDVHDDHVSIICPNIHYITDQEVEEGKSPNTAEVADLTFGIVISTEEANTWLSIELNIGGRIIRISNDGSILIYEPYSRVVTFDPESSDSLVLSDLHTTGYISGISYIRQGTLLFTSKKLLNSCYIASKSTDRIKVEVGESGAVGTSIYSHGTTSLKPESDWKSNTEIYVDEAPYLIKLGSPGYFGNNVTFNYGYYDRDDKYTRDSSVINSNNFNTKVSKATSLYEDFITENTISTEGTNKPYCRKAEMPAGPEDWDSTVSLRNDQGLYKGLLVQNGNLYWPCASNDRTTGVYKDNIDPAGTKRTYMRKFWSTASDASNKALSKFDITIKGITTIDVEGLKIYMWPVTGSRGIAGTKMNHAMQINKRISNTAKLPGYNSSTNGIASSVVANTSQNSVKIQCEVLNSVMGDLDPSQADGFWLYIEMEKTGDTENLTTIKEINVEF